MIKLDPKIVFKNEKDRIAEKISSIRALYHLRNEIAKAFPQRIEVSSFRLQ